jgi:dCTP deaminase
MVLSDHEIRERATRDRMIEPFTARQVKEVDGQGVVSFGLSSYGYDFRVANEFKVFKATYMPMVDPKNFASTSFDEVIAPDHSAVIVPPNSFALARTVEYFRIPRDIICVVLGKSTYARCGIIVNITPLEPEWEGQVTIEISNTTPLPAKIYAGEGIGQVLFLRGSEVCEVSYADKKGKYQAQQGVVLPRL